MYGDAEKDKESSADGSFADSVSLAGSGSETDEFAEEDFGMGDEAIAGKEEGVLDLGDDSFSNMSMGESANDTSENSLDQIGEGTVDDEFGDGDGFGDADEAFPPIQKAPHADRNLPDLIKITPPPESVATKTKRSSVIDLSDDSFDFVKEDSENSSLDFHP